MQNQWFHRDIFEEIWYIYQLTWAPCPLLARVSGIVCKLTTFLLSTFTGPIGSQFTQTLPSGLHTVGHIKFAYFSLTLPWPNIEKYFTDAASELQCSSPCLLFYGCDFWAIHTKVQLRMKFPDFCPDRGDPAYSSIISNPFAIKAVIFILHGACFLG